MPTAVWIVPPEFEYVDPVRKARSKGATLFQNKIYSMGQFFFSQLIRK